MAITVKIAVELAFQFFRDTYSSENNFTDVRLEEVELTEDERFWIVAIGYSENILIESLVPSKRKYKIFKIDADSGLVLSMKVRSQGN